MRPMPARRTSLIGVAIAVAGVVWPVRAHHTIPPGTFQDSFTDVEGVVKEVRMKPPHAWIILEVKSENGEPQVWPLEAASPAALEDIGITSDYVKTGDSIKARCRRAVVVRADHDCILGFIKTKDGTVKDWSGNNAQAPAD